MTPQQASEARQKKMAEIEKESADRTGLRSDIVTLYHGGLYHLYRYKKFTDVRLVFSPEVQVASFGGDIDNFEFPRFNFDITFFRAYENAKPVRPEYYLKWNASGAAENDLVFVIGNPSSTNRLDTIAGLKFRRDVFLPYYLTRMQYREALFRNFSDLGKRERQIVGEKQHDAANSLKSAAGQYRGLLDASMMKTKESNEEKFRSEVSSNPELKATAAGAWDQIEKSVSSRKDFWHEYMLLEKGDAFDSTLFEIARSLTRMVMELQKPGPERLREYRDSNLDSLKQKLYSPAPISAELEQAQITAALIFLGQNLGGDHPWVQQILEGRSPEARAEELVAGTKLFDPAYRKQIAESGLSAIQQSQDRMIQLAYKIDPDARKLRKRYESEVEEVERQAYAKIEAARFRTIGKSQYPDGTFTLRFAYGAVKSYEEGGKTIPMATTIGGAFSRSEDHDNQPPFSLPESWRKSKQNLNLEARLNFVSDADTYSGNSGSPVMNRAGEFVGINFDRNRYGLSRNFIYTSEMARQISVHPAAIVEALRNIYKADSLLTELDASK
jgi:hypothetical protein